jgi:transcriptional regulator with XRE-family HTH domain
MYSYRMTRRALDPEGRKYGARLGRALAAERERAELSGGELSRRSGVSLDAIRSIEGGRVASPGFRIVAALAKALGVSLDALSRQVTSKPRSTR